jgi:hypothetical protein
MGAEWWEGQKPLTKFAPNFKVPLYIAKDGSKDFITRMTNYVLDVEKNIIEHEQLVSPVPKPEVDPYQHTQQWKQHNLLDDVVGEGGEHLVRFPKDPVIDELFGIIRTHYLTHLAELRYPRIKTYIHGWANVLRGDQWISRHTHMTHNEAYLAMTYYLTTNDTNLYLENPIRAFEKVEIKTEARKIIMFPSWIPHWSDKCEKGSLRISLAFDIVTEGVVAGNPWRPHMLFDDPMTMPGLEGK